MKKKIVHFIFNLGRGGAETMIVRVIRELPEFEHTVVTLFPLNNFGPELVCDKLICLNLHSLFGLPFAVLKFRKLVRIEKPDIVHTHLFWPTVIARAALPRKIALITTIHTFFASSVEGQHWYILFLEKLTYRFRKSIIIFVAKGAISEYFSFLHLKPCKSYVLYTFVDTERFHIRQPLDSAGSGTFRVISVGALRKQKNYAHLVDAFASLQDLPIELDIYGSGDLETQLTKQIALTGARVVLKGEVRNIESVIPEYDLYIMSSFFEGFSLSVLEAMAMGMPLLLSDIPSFREQCGSSADYFSLHDLKDLTRKLVKLSGMSKPALNAIGEEGRRLAIGQFTLPHHVEGLRRIYADALAEHN